MIGGINLLDTGHHQLQQTILVTISQKLESSAEGHITHKVEREVRHVRDKIDFASLALFELIDELRGTDDDLGVVIFDGGGAKCVCPRNTLSCMIRA